MHLFHLEQLILHYCIFKTLQYRDRRDRDRMIVELISTYSISAYHH